MTLCDVGNTNATFFENGKITKIKLENFKDFKSDERIYFISVNDEMTQRLRGLSKFVNLEPYFELDTIYSGLGIDRVASCYAVKNGLIIDAGSAITMDVMMDSMHLGGTIMPGISHLLKACQAISPRLKISLNSQIDLDALPQKTADAVSYGIIKPILLLIENMANGSKIYFTGGDGEFLSRFFTDSIYDRMLVFRGMQKLIEQKKDILC